MSKHTVFIKSMLTIGALFGAFKAAAGSGPAGFSYEGRLYDLSGNPSAQRVNVEASILGKASSCVLRSEQFANIDLAQSSGYFSVTIGSGSSVQGLGLSALLLNSGTLTGLASCSYSPVSGDSRLLHIRISSDGGATWTDMSPDVEIGSAPYAMVADTVQGKSATDFLQLGGNAQMTQPNIESLLATPANLAEMQALAAGNSTKYAKSSSTTGVLVPSSASQPASPQVGQMWYESGTMRFWNGTSAQTLGTSTGLSSLVVGSGLVDGVGASGTTITASGTIALPNVGTAGTYFKVTTDAYGRVSSGVASLVEADLPTLTSPGKVNGSAITAGTIGGTTAINTSGNITSASVSTTSVGVNNLQVFNAGNVYKVTFTSPAGMSGNYGLILPPTLPGTSGQVLTSDTAGNLTWTAPSGGTVASVTANAPLSVTGGASSPIVNISQATTSTNGYLSSADWNAFNGKLGSSLPSGQIFVGSAGNLAAPVVAGGDISVSNTGVFSVNAVKGKFVSAPPTLAGQVLRYDGTNITPNFIAMTDLRSSVTGTSQFATACAANQTLTYNSVGDVMGCANIAINASQVSGGVLSVAGVGIGTTSPSSLLHVLGNVSAPIGATVQNTNAVSGAHAEFAARNDTGSVMTMGTTAFGNVESSVYSADVGYLISNGTGGMNIGNLNSGSPIRFVTNNGTDNNERVRIAGNGSVGIGTAAPGALLDVAGDALINGVKIGKGNGNFSENIAIGANTLMSTTSNYNTAVGIFALQSNTAGTDNVAIGGVALRYNTTGSGNTALGRFTLQNNSNGGNNTGLGWQALNANTTSSGNTAVGASSLNYSTGPNNTAVGAGAGNGNTFSGAGNTFIGAGSGSAMTTGSYNVIIGGYSGSAMAASSNNIVLSDGSGTEKMRINGAGNVGIGTTTPTKKLEVAGTFQAGSGASPDISLGGPGATPFSQVISAVVNTNATAPGFGLSTSATAGSSLQGILALASVGGGFTSVVSGDTVMCSPHGGSAALPSNLTWSCSVQGGSGNIVLNLYCASGTTCTLPTTWRVTVIRF